MKHQKKEMKLIMKKQLTIEENKIKEISDKLAKNENNSLKSTYEILCDILKNNLNEKLMTKFKEISSKISYFIKINKLELI